MTGVPILTSSANYLPYDSESKPMTRQYDLTGEAVTIDSAGKGGASAMSTMNASSSRFRKTKTEKEPFVRNAILEDLRDLEDLTEPDATPADANEATQKVPPA